MMVVAQHVAAALCALGILASLVGAWQARPGKAQTSPQRGVHVALFGVNARDAQTRNTVQFDAARSIHASLVRLPVSWAWLERPSKGQWVPAQLAWLDVTIADANARGLRPIANFMQAPCWASSDPAKNCSTGAFDEWYQPTNPQDYADALAFLAARYGNKVAAWEIWNEPNWTPFWPGQIDAARYAALLKAVRSTTSFRPLIGGVTASADVPYLEQLYANGALGTWDIYSFHVYPAAPDACDVVAYSLTCGASALHQSMLAHGDTSSIWVTEIGVSTYWVSPAEQAAFVTGIDQVVRGLSYVGGWIWFELYDIGYYHYSPAPKGEITGFGLYDKTGREKPAAAAFRALP